ncbi:hypothetical protein [Methylobacterium radiodurans]|uniref:hypothetical protein n=1 Tax=Methylobacterium radiodurans TaxID=2202828 RepID=UPI0013A55EDC|nr:hypothetical protein [Methylobacterium radiodurans]
MRSFAERAITRSALAARTPLANAHRLVGRGDAPVRVNVEADEVGEHPEDYRRPQAGSMRIIAARATAIAVMLPVLDSAGWLGEFGTPLVIASCVAAAAALATIMVLARW